MEKLEKLLTQKAEELASKRAFADWQQNTSHTQVSLKPLCDRLNSYLRNSHTIEVNNLKRLILDVMKKDYFKRAYEEVQEDFFEKVQRVDNPTSKLKF